MIDPAAVKKKMEEFKTYLAELKSLKKSINSTTSRRKIQTIFDKFEAESEQTTFEFEKYKGKELKDLKIKYTDLIEEFEEMKDDLYHQITKLEANGVNEEYHTPEKQEPQSDALIRYEQETEEVDYLANETREIANAMRDIDNVTNKLNDEIQNQRFIVRSVDDKIQATTETMEKGNQSLEKAQEYQPKCRI